MQYLLDTVTLIRQLSGSGKLGKKAALILREDGLRNDTFIISIISLMEVLYLSEKNRIDINLDDVLQLVETSTNYRIIDLNAEILLSARGINFPELHDRMILATAKYLGVPIISSDRKFRHVPDIQTVWN